MSALGDKRQNSMEVKEALLNGSQELSRSSSQLWSLWCYVHNGCLTLLFVLLFIIHAMHLNNFRCKTPWGRRCNHHNTPGLLFLFSACIQHNIILWPFCDCCKKKQHKKFSYLKEIACQHKHTSIIITALLVRMSFIVHIWFITDRTTRFRLFSNLTKENLCDFFKLPFLIFAIKFQLNENDQTTSVVKSYLRAPDFFVCAYEYNFFSFLQTN